MTLVIAVAAGTHIYQASDRRLIRLPDGALIDDERNKAVVVDGRMAFSYSGLAVLPSGRTDEWLTRVIAAGSCSEMAGVIERITDRATEEFGRLHYPSALKRHAFQGVGWIRPRDHPALIPMMVSVSNALNRDGSWSQDAAPVFSKRIDLFPDLRDRHVAIRTVGQTLTRTETARLYRSLRRAIRQQVTEEMVLRLLVFHFRELSDVYPSIGRSLMLVSMPRRAVEQMLATNERYLLTGPPTPNLVTFHYVPQNAEQLESYGPSFVTDAGTAANMTIRRLQPPQA